MMGGVSALLVAIRLSTSAWAEDLDSRAAQLANLRREVETLSADLASRKEDLRADLRAIDGQKSEILVQIRREELRLAQVQGEAEARSAELATHASRGESLAPAVLSAISGVRDVVAHGLPLRLAERLGDLDALRAQLEGGTLNPEQAAARLWAFAEDELRLSRENGLDRQVVSVGGEELLADVVHLGMVAMYFRAEGGRVGVAVRRGDTFAWELLEDGDAVRQVGLLFDKMKHGVRSGAFLLPGPWGGT
jgi:hypothetical protein